jgi:hypothetical protein
MVPGSVSHEVCKGIYEKWIMDLICSFIREREIERERQRERMGKR